MSDTLKVFGTTYNNVAGFKATDSSDNTKTYIRPTGTKQIAANGTNIDVAEYASVDVAVPVGISIDDIAQNSSPSGNIVLSDSVTQIASNAFMGKAITSISGNEVTKVLSQSFRFCTALTSVSFPNCTHLGNATSTSQDRYSFGGCTKLQNFDLKKVQYCYGGYLFYGVGSSSYPATLVLPSIISFASGGAFRTGVFNAIDFGEGLTSIPGEAFYQGTFKNLILRRKDSIVSATNADAIKRLTTALNSTIWIPKVLYDHLGDGTSLDYESATNWSSATRTYAQIEGSIYENAYADGTLIPT